MDIARLVQDQITQNATQAADNREREQRICKYRDWLADRGEAVDVGQMPTPHMVVAGSDEAKTLRAAIAANAKCLPAPIKNADGELVASPFAELMVTANDDKDTQRAKRQVAKRIAENAAIATGVLLVPAGFVDKIGGRTLFPQSARRLLSAPK